MSKVLEEVLSANQEYSTSFADKANLALPPASRCLRVWMPGLIHPNSLVWRRGTPT
jgi:hypothetical protein